MATAEEVYDEIHKRIAQKIRELPPIMGNEAVAFAKNSFDQEAWSGDAQEPWKKRKNPTKWGKKDETGRKILTKTGALRRSIRVSRVEEKKVWIAAGGTGIGYARVHNYGFRGPVKQYVKPFTRSVRGKSQQVRGFSRTIHQNIPKRQFIGGKSESVYLRNRLRRVAMAELEWAFKSK